MNNKDRRSYYNNYFKDETLRILVTVNKNKMPGLYSFLKNKKNRATYLKQVAECDRRAIYELDEIFR